MKEDHVAIKKLLDTSKQLKLGSGHWGKKIKHPWTPIVLSNFANEFPSPIPFLERLGTHPEVRNVISATHKNKGEISGHSKNPKL